MKAPGHSLLRCAVTAALLAAVLLAEQAPARAAEAGTLHLWPSQVKQGGAIFATFQPAVEVSEVAFRWQNRAWPQAEVDGQYRCVLPVNYDVPRGAGKVAVTGEMADGSRFWVEAAVIVKPTHFTVQYLRLSKSSASLYTYPGVEDEYRAIGQALRRMTPVQSWVLPLGRPVAGRVSTEYGLKRYVNGADPYRHKGVDLAAAKGTPVLAAAAGTVALARSDFRLHGQTVIVDHGLGLCTLYLHLSQVLVQPGQQVQAGDTLGLVGATGVATGPHLHWGVYVQGVATNPLWWLQVKAPGSE